jgi:hypothetical protein
MLESQQRWEGDGASEQNRFPLVRLLAPRRRADRHRRRRAQPERGARGRCGRDRDRRGVRPRSPRRPPARLAVPAARRDRRRDQTSAAAQETRRSQSNRSRPPSRSGSGGAPARATRPSGRAGHEPDELQPPPRGHTGAVRPTPTRANRTLPRGVGESRPRARAARLGQPQRNPHHVRPRPATLRR